MPGPGVEPFAGSPAVLAEAFAGFGAEGIDHPQLQLGPATPDAIAAIGDALALLQRG